MKKTKIIHSLWLGSIALLLFTITGAAAPVIRQGISLEPGPLSFILGVFRQDLGGQHNGVGNSYTSGYREITFEDMPGNVNSPAQQIPEFYNVFSPRGVVFNPVQASGFGNMHPLAFSVDNFADYHNGYKPYSGNTIFSPGLLNHLDITFRIPGTKIPASVRGFGAVFTDVDISGHTWVCLYDEAGRLVETLLPEDLDNGLTFIGASFNDGTRISRVSIRFGNLGLYNGGGESFSTDRVAMDNIIIGEPRAIEHHPSDFDGDGTSDTAVFRPADGTWYVLNSGTNTFTTQQFGTNGDIPVDGDFDGDSRNDPTVFRPSTGVWYSRRSSNNQVRVQPFGLAGDKPVVGDYDKDGTSDFAVWRPSNGNYWVYRSSDNQAEVMHWGQNGDIPIGAVGF